MNLMKHKACPAWLSTAAMVAVLVVLSACSTPMTSAPIIDRSIDRNTPLPASVLRPGAATSATPGAGKGGFHTVKKGDTIYRIALDYGVNYTDLLNWNNLQGPSDLKVDQVLRVTPPEGGAVVSSAPIRSSALEARPLGSNGQPLKGGSLPAAQTVAPTVSTPTSNTTTPIVVAPVVPPVAAPTVPATPSTTTTIEPIDWQWPANGKVITEFEEAKTKGIDIADKEGSPIFAAADGKVMFAGNGPRGYGNLIIIKHSNGYLSAYGHNKALLVKEGETVKKSQKIAEMGSTETDRSKLHFEIRNQGKPIDPAKLLPVR